MNDQVASTETAKILELAQTCTQLDGDFVEFGCYRGDTSVELAKILKQSEKRLYAYDSFEGLPAKSPEDESAAGVNFQPGVLHVSRHALIDKLKKHGLTNVIIKKAWFSDLTSQDLPKDIAFAFLDGDFYESQRTALALVQPRLVPQGIIVCHDYNNPELPGATQAVDEFLQQHPEYCLTVFQTLAILR